MKWSVQYVCNSHRVKGPLQYKYSCFSSCRKYQYNQSLVLGEFLEWTVNELQCFSFINYMISHAPSPASQNCPKLSDLASHVTLRHRENLPTFCCIARKFFSIVFTCFSVATFFFNEKVWFLRQFSWYFPLNFTMPSMCIVGWLL